MTHNHTRKHSLQEAEKAGDDFDQLKMLDSQADELERMDRKRKKKNPDPGFAGG